MSTMSTIAAHPRPPRADGPRPERPAAAAPGRRAVMAASCYVGLAMIVALTVLLSRCAPTPVAVGVFLVGAVALVAVFHPRVTLRR